MIELESDLIISSSDCRVHSVSTRAQERLQPLTTGDFPGHEVCNFEAIQMCLLILIVQVDTVTIMCSGKPNNIMYE